MKAAKSASIEKLVLHVCNCKRNKCARSKYNNHCPGNNSRQGDIFDITTLSAEDSAVLVFLTPFVYVGAMAGLYLFGPEDRRPTIQSNLTSRPNFYLGSAVALVFLALVADYTVVYGRSWLAILAWLVTVGLTVLSVQRAMAPPPKDDAKPTDFV
jgi:hypothetical protein